MRRWVGAGWGRVVPALPKARSVAACQAWLCISAVEPNPLSHPLLRQAADERAAGLAQQVQQLERQAADLRSQLGDAANKHVQVGWRQMIAECWGRPCGLVDVGPAVSTIRAACGPP